MLSIHVILLLLNVVQVQSWAPMTSKNPRANPLTLFASTASSNADATTTSKNAFLESLDYLDRMNIHNTDRTRLLQDMIDNKVEISVDEYVQGTTYTGVSIQNPASWESMQAVAKGTWKVVYAPHMTIMSNLAGGGTLGVSYILRQDGTMSSHAVCDFDWLPFGRVILSVSGTWGTVSSQVCRVDFDRAWITLNQEEPYATFEDVPDDDSKSIISFLGRLFFVEAVSVFPISFLDENLIVFDFELLGTRICARKIDV